MTEGKYRSAVKADTGERPMRPPPPAAPPSAVSYDQRTARLQAEALQDIGLCIGRLAAVAERLSIEVLDPDHATSIAGAICRLAEAIQGQRFATSVTATFAQTD